MLEKKEKHLWRYIVQARAMEEFLLKLVSGELKLDQERGAVQAEHVGGMRGNVGYHGVYFDLQSKLLDPEEY